MAGSGGRRREALLPEASFGGSSGRAPPLAQLSHVHSVTSERMVAELPLGEFSASLHGGDDEAAPVPAAAEAPAPLPAYTSLARQQLHARLKAAISSGRKTAEGAASGRTGGAFGQRQPKRGAGHPGAAGSASALAASAARPCAIAALLPDAPVVASRPGSGYTQHVCASLDARGLPTLHRTASGQCEQDAAAGFQLPPPRVPSLRRGQRHRTGPPGSGVAAASPRKPAATAALAAQPGSATAPHWLGAQLLHSRLYHAPVLQGRGHGSDGAGQAQRRGARQQQGVQRGLLLLRMPPLTERFAESMPVRVADADGQPCLLVLPSDSPSSRAEAAAAVEVLLQLLADPAAAAARAAAWRQQLLLSSSSAALLGLVAGFDAPPGVRREAWGAPARAGSPGGGAGGALAGPAWLAGSSVAGNAGCELVQAVRDTSHFLHSGAAEAAAKATLRPLPPPTGRPPPASPPAPHLSLQLPACGARSASAAPPAPLPPAPGSAPGGGGGQDPAWDSFCFASLAAGLAACMAEAVRQVEVGCAERGRLLALLWNGYTGVLSATLQQQQEQLLALAADNANLAAEASLLRWEASSAEFLRREIMRLRNDQETANLALQDSREEAAALQDALAAAEERQGQLEGHLRRRRAALRWRYAAAAALLPAAARAEAVQSCGLGFSPDAAATPLIDQLAGVEAAAAATVALQQRRRDWRERGRAEAAVAAALGAASAAAGAHSAAAALGAGSGGGPRGFGPPRQPSRLRPSTNGAAAAAVAAHAGEQPSLAGPAPAPLHHLRPEARAVVLLGLPPPQRQALLAASNDGERAGLVVHLEEPARLQLYSDMGPVLAAATDAAIHRKPLLLARLLAGQATEAAQHTFAGLGRRLQAAVVAAAPRQLAAGLVLGLEAAEQLEVLLEVPASGAAALLQWTPPAAGLQLLLAAAELDGRQQERQAHPATHQPQQQQQRRQGAAAVPRGAAWAEEVLAALPERHLSAMLAAALPAEVAVLLPLAPRAQQHALLRLVPTAGTRSAALALAHQRRAAAARAAAEAAAAAGQPASPAGSAACSEDAATGRPAPLDPEPSQQGAAAATGSCAQPQAAAASCSAPAAPSSCSSGDPAGSALRKQEEPSPQGCQAAVEAAAAAGEAAAEEETGTLPPLDAASALHAHFQLLTAAEKTHLLLMGPPAAAALLLPLLEGGDMGEVLSLLPQERQDQLLRTLSPAAEARLQAAARAAARRRSSLLLPQLGPVAAAAAAGEPADGSGERRGSLQSQQQQQQQQQRGPGMLRRSSSQRQRAASLAPLPPRRVSACSAGSSRLPSIQAAAQEGR